MTRAENPCTRRWRLSREDPRAGAAAMTERRRPASEGLLQASVNQAVGDPT